MGKINCRFDGQSDTIFYSVRNRKFYSYEKDGEILHQLYGGGQYYTSCSRLSGAGYLEPKPQDNDLIKFGFYRTDCMDEQHKEIVSHTLDGNPIFGYVPIASHKGIDENFPVILTDGQNVVFASIYNAVYYLPNFSELWNDDRIKTINAVYYDSRGFGRDYTFHLRNDNHLKGIRVTRFVDLRSMRSQTNETPTVREGLFGEKLSIYKTEANMLHEQVCYLHQNNDGVFDRKWVENPRNIDGEIVNGWVGNGGDLFWRRKGDVIEAFMEIERSQVSDSPIESGWELISYEINFSVIEWFSTDIADIRERFLARLEEKAREDYEYIRRTSGADTRTLMEANQNTVITITDSTNAGNCEVGTMRFVEAYGIALKDGGISIRNLLANENIDKMLRNEAFRKVVHRVITK